MNTETNWTNYPDVDEAATSLRRKLSAERIPFKRVFRKRLTSARHRIIVEAPAQWHGCIKAAAREFVGLRWHDGLQANVVNFVLEIKEERI